MKEQVVLMMRLVAVAAYLTVGVVPYLGSGLVAPPYGVAVLWALWLAGWVPLVRMMRRSPHWAWGVSIAAVAAWVAIVGAGGAFLGWSA